MISTKQIAKIIEDKLNAIAGSGNMPFGFSIYAEQKEYKGALADETRKSLPKPLINGVLISLPSSIVPLQNLKSYTASQTLDLLVPCDPKAPDNGITEAMSVIQAFVENTAGLAGVLNEENADGTETGVSYAYVVSPQLPQVGTASVQGLGFWYVPVSVFMTWQFIEGGVVGNTVKVTVDGEAVLVMEGGFERTRVTETNNKDNSEEMKATIGQQGLTMRVVTPYIKGGVGQKLVQDLLTGSLGKTYAVTCDDGVISPVTWKMVATEIKQGIAAGTPVSVSAVMTIASDVYDDEES